MRLLQLLEITHETREQIRAAPAVENDELLKVHEIVSEVRQKLAEREADKKAKKGRWRRR